MSDLCNESSRRAVTVSSRPLKFAHIVMRTARYEEMRTFYTSLLLAESVFDNGVLNFIRYDEEHHRIVLVNAPDASDSPAGAAGTDHIAFTYADLGDLLGTHRRLAELGIHPAWCINHGITTSIYYRDPDGTMVETQIDNLGNEAADAFMRDPYFATNPIGVDFDPVLLLRRFERGDPLVDLLRQGSAPYREDVEPTRPPGLPDYDSRGRLLPDGIPHADCVDGLAPTGR